MTNWCKNKVTFSGSKECLDKVMNLFLSMIKRVNSGVVQAKRNCANGSNDDFLKMSIDVTNEYTIQYETKWSPNTDLLKMISHHYNVGFILEYEEPSCMVFGKTNYENKILQNCFVNQCDLKEIGFIEKAEYYEFEGAIFTNTNEIAKILLERKSTTQKRISMSILSDTTESKVLEIVDDIMKEFEKFEFLNITKEDDIDLWRARNLLKTVLDSNDDKVY